jgi:tryptophan-rich sensory protein
MSSGVSQRVFRYDYENADTSMSRHNQIAGLAVSLLVVFGIATLGGVLTNLSVATWYPSLGKPSWTPSGATIGTVWTVLYTVMGIAAWIVWRSGFGGRQRPLAIYALQLLLNAGWSALFFGLRSPGWALLEIGILWLAILATSVTFWKVSKLAGALMIPYLLWVTFAGVLNALVWKMN